MKTIFFPFLLGLFVLFSCAETEEKHDDSEPTAQTARKYERPRRVNGKGQNKTYSYFKENAFDVIAKVSSSEFGLKVNLNLEQSGNFEKDMEEIKDGFEQIDQDFPLGALKTIHFHGHDKRTDLVMDISSIKAIQDHLIAKKGAVDPDLINKNLSQSKYIQGIMASIDKHGFTLNKVFAEKCFAVKAKARKGEVLPIQYQLHCRTITMDLKASPNPS